MSRRPLPPLKPDAAPITMVDLRGQHAALKQEILQAMTQVLDSGRYILGPNVEAFEREAAAYLGVLPNFHNRELTKAAGSILGDEAMHWAVLLHALGEDPVPGAFVG